MALSNGGVRDIVDVTIYNIVTGTPVLFLESLKTSSTETKADIVFSRGGRNNPRRIAWNSSKDIDFKAQDCHISPEQLSLLYGTTTVKGSTLNYSQISEGFYLNSSSPVFTLRATPVSSTPYPTQVFGTINNNGRDIDTAAAFTSNATPTTNHYKITTNSIQFGGDYSSTPAYVVVNYYRQHTSGTKRITITSDTFPATYKITGWTLWRSEADGLDYPAMITIPKAKLDSNFTIEQAAEGEPAVFDMNFMVLKPSTSSTMYIMDIMETAIS